MRLTRDADIAVSVGSDPEAEALILELSQRGHRVLAVVEDDRTGRLSAARLTHLDSERSVVTDLLFASCGIEPEIVEAAVVETILSGLSAPVATTGHLIATKLLARDDRRRPTDADDLRALRAVAVEEDWQIAESAVELITARGFNRGRDLGTSLRTLRTRGAYSED